MKDMTEDVHALLKGLKAATRQIDRLIMRAERLAVVRTAEEKKAKTKATATRKGPAKRLMRRKTGALTATDHVLGIIQRAKKGVDVAALAKKTGFEQNRIRSILTSALKQGRIERSGRGIYVAAAERRRRPRIDSLNLLWYACIDENDQVVREGMGRTINVTEEGILLETHRPMDQEEIVSLCIGVKDDVLSVKKGKVVYCRKGQGGKFRSGIEFTEADEQDIRTLKRFIIAFRREQ